MLPVLGHCIHDTEVNSLSKLLAVFKMVILSAANLNKSGFVITWVSKYLLKVKYGKSIPTQILSTTLPGNDVFGKRQFMFEPQNGIYKPLTDRGSMHFFEDPA